MVSFTFSLLLLWLFVYEQYQLIYDDIFDGELSDNLLVYSDVIT